MPDRDNIENLGFAYDCVHSHPCLRVLKICRLQIANEINKKNEGKDLKIKLSLACGEGKCKCYQRKDAATIEAEKKQRQEDYYQSLNNPDFEALSMQVFKRDGFQCQKCKTAKNLVVHHINYERLGHEKLSDLVTLCKSCHKKVHEEDFNDTNTED